MPKDTSTYGCNSWRSNRQPLESYTNRSKSRIIINNKIWEGGGWVRVIHLNFALLFPFGPAPMSHQWVQSHSLGNSDLAQQSTKCNYLNFAYLISENNYLHPTCKKSPEKAKVLSDKESLLSKTNKKSKRKAIILPRAYNT